jgi:hypothetical protein
MKSLNGEEAIELFLRFFQPQMPNEVLRSVLVVVSAGLLSTGSKGGRNGGSWWLRIGA